MKRLLLLLVLLCLSVTAHADGLFGYRVLPTTSGSSLTIVSGTFNVQSVASAQNAWLEIWTDNGSGSPGTQIGTDSASVSVSTAGEKSVTWNTPVSLAGVTTFWAVVQVDGGDVNYNGNTSLVGTGVDGGDTANGTGVTSLVSGTTEIPRISVLLSDDTRLGNRDTGTTNILTMDQTTDALGLKITIP